MKTSLIAVAALACGACSSLPYVHREDHMKDLDVVRQQMDRLEGQKAALHAGAEAERAALKVAKEQTSLCLREKSGLDDDLASTKKALDGCTQSRGSAAKELATCQMDKDKVDRSIVLCGADRKRLEGDLAAQQQASAAGKAELDRLHGQLSKVEAGIQQVKGKLQKLIDGGTLRIKTQHGFLVIEVSSDILFDLNRAELKPGAGPVLGQVAAALKELADKRFQVAGHTDNTGPAALNWKLSTERALAVIAELVAQGMPPANLSAGGYGPYLAVAPNDTDEGRAKNRRVEFLLLPDLSELFRLVK